MPQPNKNRKAKSLFVAAFILVNVINEPVTADAGQISLDASLDIATTSKSPSKDEQAKLVERPQLSPDQAARLDPKEVIFLDVRTSPEWWLGHVKGAKHLPVGDISSASAAQLQKLFPNKDIPIVTYCAVGGRANKAVELLEAKGYAAIAVTSGGYKELKAEGIITE